MAARVAKEKIESARVGRWFVPSLAGLFFLSGVCGLIYQVLWLRQLALIFGVTIYAASTVLASFMAGLALGSYIAGRLVDRARNPLLWYGVAEVLIGLSALVTPFAFDALGRLYSGLYPSLLSSPGVMTALRFLLSFCVLIVPTTLMGATLPIIIKSALLRTEGLGGRVSFLYATNTAGAVCGALVAGFYLIGSLGMAQSFKLAAAVNALVGVVAIALAMKLKPKLPESDADLNAADAQDPIDHGSGLMIARGTRRLVLLVFALSGLISLALEVVWFRILILFLDATTYAFTTMLATVLSGIAVGSYLITPLMKKRFNWLKLLALTELAMAVTVAFSLAALDLAYGGADPAAGEVSSPTTGTALWVSLSVSFIAMFPSAVLMGIAFPIGMRLAAGDGESDSTLTGKKVGLFYALNVFGAILGPAVAGFLLLPLLGSRGSLRLLAALILFSGLSLLAALPRSQRFFATSSAAVGTALVLTLAANMPDPFALVLGYRYPGEQLLWREEGVQTTASVHESKGRRILYLNGLHQANDSPTMVRNHRLLGYLAMLLHPNPKDVLVIGLGGGVTVGAASEHPGVNVEVVELSKTVLHAADWFSDVNNNALRQPNVVPYIDDGRNYMMLTSKRYDVITADLTRPDHAGAGNLYSAEYFKHARNALKEDGLMVQWNTVQSEKHYKLIMRTFLEVFPYTTLWAKGKIMVGSKHPLQLDPANFDRKLQDPAFQRAIESINLGSFESLVSRYSAGPEELNEFVGPGPILSDDQPRAEYFLSLSGSDRKVKNKRWKGDMPPLINH